MTQSTQNREKLHAIASSQVIHGSQTHSPRSLSHPPFSLELNCTRECALILHFDNLFFPHNYAIYDSFDSWYSQSQIDTTRRRLWCLTRLRFRYKQQWEEGNQACFSGSALCDVTSLLGGAYCAQHLTSIYYAEAYHAIHTSTLVSGITHRHFSRVSFF